MSSRVLRSRGVIALGADHAGYVLKEGVLDWLKQQNVEVLDFGAYQLDPQDDYPDFAAEVAIAVSHNQAYRGIIICGSGVGASFAANKIPGVRASVCHDIYSATQGVEHDDLNVLCLGSRVISNEFARELILAFLGAEFTGEERHVRRLEKVKVLERDGQKAINRSKGE